MRAPSLLSLRRCTVVSAFVAISLGAATRADAQFEVPGIGIESEFATIQVSLKINALPAGTHASFNTMIGGLYNPLVFNSDTNDLMVAVTAAGSKINGVDLLRAEVDMGIDVGLSQTLELVGGPVGAKIADQTRIMNAMKAFVTAIETHAGTPWGTYVANNKADHDAIAAGMSDGAGAAGKYTYQKVVTLAQAIEAYNVRVQALGDGYAPYTMTIRPEYSNPRLAEVVFLVPKAVASERPANPQGNFGVTLSQYGAGALVADYGPAGTVAAPNPARDWYVALSGGMQAWLTANGLAGQADNPVVKALFVYMRLHFMLKTMNQHPVAKKNNWMNMPKAPFDQIVANMSAGARAAINAWGQDIDDARATAICAGLAAKNDVCKAAVMHDRANLWQTHVDAPKTIKVFTIGGYSAMAIESRIPPLAVRAGFQFTRTSNAATGAVAGWDYNLAALTTAVNTVCAINGLGADCR